MRLRLSQRLKSFWENSQTKIWAYAQLIGSGILASADKLNQWISDPTFKSYLDTIDVPKSVIIVLATFGLLTYIFHGHDDA